MAFHELRTSNAARAHYQEVYKMGLMMFEISMELQNLRMTGYKALTQSDNTSVGRLIDRMRDVGRSLRDLALEYDAVEDPHAADRARHRKERHQETTKADSFVSHPRDDDANDPGVLSMRIRAADEDAIRAGVNANGFALSPGQMARKHEMDTGKLTIEEIYRKFPITEKFLLKMFDEVEEK